MTKSVSNKTRNITVKASYLAALAPFMSKEETRFCLQGVFIAPHRSHRGAGRGIVLVATDGHRMGVIHDPDGETNGEWICPIPQALERAILSKKTNAVQAVLGGDVCTLKDGEGKTVFQHFAPPIDGTYPDWKRVIPTKRAQGREPAAFNPKYLGDFQKVIAALTTHKVLPVAIWASDPHSPAIVQIEGVPEFIGIQMPMRHSLAGLPDWFSPYLPTTDEKPAKPKAAPRKKAA